MTSSISFVIFFCLICSIETTIGPGSRKVPARAAEKVVSTPSPAAQSLPPTAPFEAFPPAKTNALQRRLVEENINPQIILETHESYCATCTETREFNNPSLVYVTPWNSHGYDIAKMFTKKFDYIAPVWLSVKRAGFEKYIIEGTQDIDKKWIETLKENNPKIRIVPRVIFEKFSVDDIHALFESEDEKQQLATTFAKFLIEHKDLFDGYVIEILMQFRGTSKPTLNHIISHIAEHIHEINDNDKKKEIILAIPPYDEIFDKNDFEMLYEHLDGFSVMTYDFPNREPGPVAPLEWVESTMEKFSKPENEGRIKVFLGLNFYGYRYDRAGSAVKKDQQQQYGMKPIVGRDYIDFLKKNYATSAIIYDPRVREHITVIQVRPTKQQQHPLPETIIFYPSLKSIYERLELATKLNVGIAIWDGGQGLDYFYDLL
ncbi:unnamed protein product [Adineta steineri]|uniref:Chitinase domain-containing protein 1 n=1 Tax=Adineta steineri TaxID=433720 RepID=A0A815EFI6_9BILA|nr:unnamed protein product [Adineta steineri]CAF1311830.1 unnamed protein product [Adineta steineri]CAF1314484.1 unnamed protein product [Adineta steineri]